MRIETNDVAARANKFRRARGIDPKLFYVLAIVLAGLVLTLPAILYGLPFYGDDGPEHAIYYSHFAEQFWSGELYPRWIQNMNGSLGSPTFFYYPPAAYYVTVFLRPFFRNDPHGWQQLGVSSSIAVMTSGLCIYLWLKKITNQKSACAAALLYMAMPYHLAFDFYSRAAFAEGWAFVWMPLILYFVDEIIRRGGRFAFVGVAISYALLVMTHTPTALIFSIAPIGYAFYLAESGARIKALIITLGAMTLGAGLSAVYLLPAMTTQQFVFIEEMKAGHYRYDNWFLFAKFNLSEGLSYHLWMTAGPTILAFGGAFLAIHSDSSRIVNRETAFWIVFVALCVLMMTPLSKHVWQIFPPLQMIKPVA